MATCPDCGQDHPQPSASAIAWADQFRAEFRDEARRIYSEALAANGITLALDQETLAKLDTMFEIGGDAMAIVLANHGAIKKAER